MKFFWQKKREEAPEVELQEGQSCVPADICKAISAVQGREFLPRSQQAVMSAVKAFPLASVIKQQRIEDEVKRIDAEILKLDCTKSGTTMPDGSIYLGCFDKKDWFVTAEDAKDAEGKRLDLNFDEALEYAKNLKAHNHTDWILPPSEDDGESHILHQMAVRQGMGDFDGTYDQKLNTAWYWSGTVISSTSVWQEYFPRDNSIKMLKNGAAHVRCVRAVSRPLTYFPSI